MGDVRFEPSYESVRDSADPTAALRGLGDEEVVAALAAASRNNDPLLANVLATEAHNRLARTRRVLASMGDAVLIERWPERVIVDVNAAAERMFGWSAAALKGSTPARLHASASGFAQSRRRTERTLLEQGIAHCSLDLVRKGGESFPTEQTVALIRDAGGDPVGVVSIVRDVSERERARERIESAERLLRAIVESTTDGIHVKDAKGKYIFSNRAGAAFARRRPEDVLGKDDRQLLGKQIGEPIMAGDRAVMASGEWLSIEDSLEVGGERRVFHSAKGPFRDEDGNVIGVIGITREVTERKRAEEALRRWEQVFRHAQWGVAVGTPDLGTLVALNPAFARMHGCEPEDLVGRPVEELCAPEVRAELPGHVRELHRKGHHSFESVHVRTDGSKFPVLVDVSATRDGDGAVLDLIVNVQDITERKAAEAARSESEERFRVAAENSAIGMAIVGLDGRFLQVNRALAEIVGYEPEELLEGTFQEITHPDDLDADLAQARRLAVGEIRSYNMEKRYVRKDGRVVWVLLTGSVVRAEKGDPRYFIAQVQDVTARKETERRLAAQNGVARVLAGARTVEEGIRGVLRVFCSVLEWDVGEYWRVDEGSGRLRLADSHFERGTAASAFRQARPEVEFAKGEGLPGLAWAAGQAVGISDVTRGTLFVRREAAERAGLRAGFGFVVRPGARVRGVATFLGRDMRGFDEEVRSLMDGIGHQVGQFVERVELEERARRIVEAAPDATLLVHPDGRIFVFNASAERLFRRAREDVFGTPVDALLAPGDRAKEALRLAAAGEGAGPGCPGSGADLAALRSDGAETPVEATFSPVETTEGVFVIACLRDVTERRRAELSVARLGAIVENSEDAIVGATPDGAITSWNAGAERLYGRDAAEALGKPLSILASKRRRREIEAILERVRRGEPVGPVEMEHDAPDGRPLTISVRFSAVRNPPGSVIGVAAIARDETARRSAEAKAARLSRLYTVLAEANEAILRAPDEATIHREVCRIVVERGGFRMAWIGMTDDASAAVVPVASAGQVDGYLDGIRITVDDAATSRGPTGTAIRTGVPFVCTDVARDPRMAPWRAGALHRGYRSSAAFPIRVGSRVVGALNVYAGEAGFFDEKESRLLVDLASDVALAVERLERRGRREEDAARLADEKRELESRLGVRARLLTDANAELEAFSYRVSHDLRAPLRGLAFFLEALRRDQRDRLDEDGREMLERATREGERMRRLIDDLLVFATSQSSEMVPLDVDLGRLAREVLDQLRQRDPSRRVETRVADGLVVRGDAGLLRIVMENLIANAWKFTRKVPAARIEVGSLVGNDGEKLLYVKDNGAGFPADQAHRLFKPFARLHAPGEFEGTGIGLATVARILRRHGGSIRAEGSPGAGATFLFTLPEPSSDAPA